MTTSQKFQLRGLTCGHCVTAVASEVSAIPGVLSADVDLVVGGLSTLTVHSANSIEGAAVAAAVDEAGYEVAQS
jgi:copper chaperone CopZ